MKKDELIKQVAKLESINDQLGAELKHLDDLGVRIQQCHRGLPRQELRLQTYPDFSRSS